MQTFLFAGASRAIAQCTAKILQDKGHKVIGISTKPKTILLLNEFIKNSIQFKLLKAKPYKHLKIKVIKKGSRF